MAIKNYRQYTQARIALGNHGPALPTKAWLEFLYNHAEAKDALYSAWDVKKSISDVQRLNFKATALATLAKDKETYLQRPDLGRLLDDDARLKLKTLPSNSDGVLLLISNGLSSAAINNHAGSLLNCLVESFDKAGLHILLDTVFLVENARVAILDDVGDILMPKVGLILIGERPGLQSPDSLSVYLTYEPHKHRTDAERNCISNIRVPDGLSYEDAAQKTVALITKSLQLGLSGICLKEDDVLVD